MQSIGGFPPYIQTNSSSDRYSYGDVPPEIAAEEQALNRKQQIANLLIQRGIQPAQGQMVGRFYVPASPIQGLAGLAQAALGAYATSKNDDARRGLSTKSNQMLVDAMQGYKKAVADKQVTSDLPGPGAPVPTGFKPGDGFTQEELAQPTALYATKQDALNAVAGKLPPQFTEGPKPTSITSVPLSPDEKRQAIIQTLAMSTHPQAQDIGKLLLQQLDSGEQRDMDREIKREGIESNALSRAETIRGNMINTQAQIEARQQAGRDANDLKQSLADQSADLKRMEIQSRKDALAQGKTPPGYRQTQTGNLEAIPGGPADLKQQGVLNQDTAMLQNSNASFDRLGQAANQVMNHPGLAGITGLRGKIPNVPGSNAADAEAMLNSLKSQVAFGVLQEMRNNSKTGGALGAVSDAEGRRLEANLASLDKAQSLDQMKSSLNSIKDYANGAKDRLRDTFNLKHKTGEPVSAAPASASGGLSADEQKELDSLRKKYGR